MMSSDQPTIIRKIVFAGINAGVVVFFFFCIILPIYSVFSARDVRIAEQSALLGRLTAISDKMEYIGAATADIKKQLVNGEFLTGASDNVIAADLQTRIKALSESAGARVRAVQILSGRIDDGLKYSGSRIQIYGSIQSIFKAIYAIETARPFLFISSASIKLGVAVASAIPREPFIEAQLDVFGVLSPESSTP